MKPIDRRAQGMKISNKQKAAVEKVTGKSWDSWDQEALRAYFAFTDRGQTVDISDGAKADYRELLDYHRFHPVTVEMWKEDFAKGLLWLDDFTDCPDAFMKHAFEIYLDVMGFIPGIHAETADRLGVSGRRGAKVEKGLEVICRS